MTVNALVGINTIMDVVNSYTSLDNKATYVWAANVLARKCPFFQDMPMKAGNQIFSNIGARVNYLNTPSTRGFNQGLTPTAVHTTQYTEPMCIIEDYGWVDKLLCDAQNNPGQWRQERDAIKMEAMVQSAENKIIYGNYSTVDSNGIQGFATRFNSTTHRPNDDSGWPYNVKSAGGSLSAQTCSIWVIEWGVEGKVYGIYPPNLPAGIHVRDLGEQTWNVSTIASPSMLQVYLTMMGLYFGLNIEDERCVQRIVNVNATGSTEIFDPEELIEVINNLPSRGAGAVIYAPRAIVTQMDINALNKQNALYRVEPNGDIWGRPVTYFRGIPVRMAEKLLETETAI